MVMKMYWLRFFPLLCTGRFIPDIKLIKERIESLIEKEYIRRSVADRYVYVCADLQTRRYTVRIDTN